MIDIARLPLVASLVLGAALVVACASPRKQPPTRHAAGPIAGVIQDDQGLPLPAVWIEVEGHPKPFTSPPAWRTDVHGRFQIDDIPPGPVRLLVTTGRAPNHSKQEIVETRTGVRDLVIVLDPGPQLLLRIVGYVPAPQERGARVTWMDPDGTRDHRWAPIRDDGWVRFVGLPPDREFELWAIAEIKRRHVRARGLGPGSVERRIERHEVKDIAGTVRASKARMESRIEEAVGPLRERLSVVVYAQAPQGAPHFEFRVAETRLEQDGSFRVRGLPPGTYAVNVGSGTGEVFWVSKRVEAGTTDAIISLD